MESEKQLKKNKIPRTIKATVKQIQSGDYIVLAKKNKNGNVVEYPLYLASINAPKVGTPQREEEPYAYDAKKWLMEHVGGEKAEFLVEYEINGRECGTLFVKEKNVNVEIAKTGFVKLNEKRKDDSVASKYYEEISKAVEEAKKKGLGLFNEKSEEAQKHKRNLVYSNTPEFDAEKVSIKIILVKESIEIGKPFKSYVEYVFSPNAVNVYVETLSIVTRVSMNHIFTPAQDRVISLEAKEFVEKLILNKIVGVVFQRIDDHGNLVGRIHHKLGDIDVELVKKGFSKVIIPQDDDYDKVHFKKLKDAQDIAQINKVGLWKDLTKTEEAKKKTKTYDPSQNTFDAKVVEVHSGDSLTVVPVGSEEQKRIFLASIKAPAMAKKEGDDHDAWAWESKEFVRKNVIGRKVKVEMEFKREIELKKEESKGAKRTMEFASVILLKTNRKLS